MRAAALNRGEFIASLGLHAAGAAAKPAGQECAGEVIEVGDGVTAFRPGDRVMGRAPGGFAEQALLDAREAMAVPERLSWEEAAADAAGVPGELRHALPGRQPRARRVAARHGRLLGRRRRVGADRQARRRERHRHVGVGGEARPAAAARARRRHPGPRRRVPRGGDEGDRRQGRRSRRERGRRHRLRGVRPRARLPRPARDRRLRRRRDAERDRPRGAALEAAAALRRVEQAAHGAAARGNGGRLRSRRAARARGRTDPPGGRQGVHRSPTCRRRRPTWSRTRRSGRSSSRAG